MPGLLQLARLSCLQLPVPIPGSEAKRETELALLGPFQDSTPGYIEFVGKIKLDNILG